MGYIIKDVNEALSEQSENKISMKKEYTSKYRGFMIEMTRSKQWIAKKDGQELQSKSFVGLMNLIDEFLERKKEVQL